MSYASPYLIPDCPPADLLAELDRAAQALDRLTARAVELTLGMDRQTAGLRIELADGAGSRPLTPTQLFELLAGD
jgi:hypothetical protein